MLVTHAHSTPFILCPSGGLFGKKDNQDGSCKLSFRASFRRLPCNGKSFLTMMSLHTNNHYARLAALPAMIVVSLTSLKEHAQIRTYQCRLPGEWADVCGFLKRPCSDPEWQVRMHEAFTIPYGTLGLREIDQSCHHKVWMHLSHTNSRGDRASRYGRAQRLHLKETISPLTTAKKDARFNGNQLEVIHLTRTPMSTEWRVPTTNVNWETNCHIPCSVCVPVVMSLVAFTSHSMSHCTNSNVSKKTTSQLRFFPRTADPQITMLWIKEVEIAK